MLDERKTKTGVKKRLIESGSPCHRCGKPFESKKGIHLHRLDEARAYSDENCARMHAECHQQHHAEGVTREAGAEEAVSTGDKAVLVKRSKAYDDMPFTYWWDIAPASGREIGTLPIVSRRNAILHLCNLVADSLRHGEKWVTSRMPLR